MSKPRRAVLVLATVLTVFACVGCNWFEGLFHLMRPEQRKDAEVTLTKNDLAIVITGSRQAADHPLFRSALHDRLADLLREHEVNASVIAYNEELELAQKHRDYRNWSITRIGRALGVEQVIHIYVPHFRLLSTPDYPVIEPEVTVRVTVVDVNAPPGMVRLWPNDPSGREVTVSRRPTENSGPEAVDTAARKLGRDVAAQVALFFYEHSLEQPIKPEP